MKGRLKMVLSACLVVGAILVASPGVADAKGVIIYHNGDDVFETGPLPAPFDKHAQLKGANAGYMCRVFGVMWAYFHIWNCRPVAVRDDTVWTDKTITEAVAKKYKESEMKVGIWKKHGRWVFALLIVGLIGLKFLPSKKEEEEEPETDEEKGEDAD
jgi:hypothetical protein